MLEIEAKYRYDDSSGVLAQLHQLGAYLLAEQQHVDTYLSAPDRDFARTDEALRLRQIGTENCVTYKGPRVDATTKTRPELEIACGQGHAAAQQWLQLFAYLGYRTVAQVRKHRRIYELRRGDFVVHCCFDDVEQVGRFVELEIVADASRYHAARELLFQLATDLRLGPTETRSYLEMLLGQTVTPGGAR